MLAIPQPPFARDGSAVHAAVLHDVLEKTSATPSELRSRFGDRVAGIVEAVSEDGAITPFGERKAAHREQVARAGTDACAVYAADKIAKRAGMKKRCRASVPSIAGMASIDTVTLEVADPTAAHDFYAAAFGLGPELQLRASEAPTTGFRGFTLSLTVSQPATVSTLIDSALQAGATPLKSAAKSLWGFGGVVQAPDGTIWKVATSKKKNSGPATREIDKIVLLLGVEDVPASKRFYVDRGLAVARNFGRKYVEFDMPSGAVTLGLYGRRALAKDAGVAQDGSGSHRLLIGSDAGPFTDPDGFEWAGSDTTSYSVSSASTLVSM